MKKELSLLWPNNKKIIKPPEIKKPTYQYYPSRVREYYGGEE
ncbi:MAG TPA: hypothetical protein PLN56_10575 [Methanoregulaceae archaeon]|nr:hypothetical protein [Methanoregulaceae archaeon]